MTYSKDRLDVTLRVREIEIEEFDSWQPKDCQKHIKEAFSRRLSVAPNMR